MMLVAKRKRLKKLGQVIVLASLMGIGALSIDAILPALSEIRLYYDVASQNGYWVITSVFFGISAGQLFLGPVSDFLGRKITGILGLVLFPAVITWLPDLMMS